MANNNNLRNIKINKPINSDSLQLLNRSPSFFQSGGSALLLRLFESQFFNLHLAISYLKTYHDSIGITYYLIDRLEKFPSKEVEFYWPQLCHLLISRPTESFALESFIVKTSHRSTHLAIKTLWYLQASLSDLSANPNTPNFVVCRRTFNRIQSFIFSDPLLELSSQAHNVDPRISKPSNSNLSYLPSDPSQNPSNVLLTPHQSDRSRKPFSWKSAQTLGYHPSTRSKSKKIGERILPTSVGIGLVLAGVALPQLAHQTGHLPIEQSKNYDQSVSISSSQKSKNPGDNSNSASDDEESDHRPPPHASHRLDLQRIPNQTKPHPRHTPRTQLSLSASTSQPNRAPLRSFHQPSPSHSSFSPGPSPQIYLNPTNIEPPSLPCSPSAQIWSSPEPLTKPPTSKPPENLQTQFSPLTPDILTAPISSTGRSSLSSLEESHAFHSNCQNLCQSSSQSQDLLASTTVSIAANASPRVHPTSAISQSAPSLPDALSKFKQDRRFNHTNNCSITHRNGRFSHHQNHPTSPIGSLSSALSIDPSQIPVGLLHQVLKSQSMRSQLELITSLQDIATRLVVVPRKARLSALRAELTVLNHSLPKGCCLGMYCDGEDCDDNEGHKKKLDSNNFENQAIGSPEGSNPKKKRCHQRIVRISPNESVVLNSADRAPFLIHVEVLEDHLDFDPNRRSNHEDLRKAIKESTISANNELYKKRQSVYPDLSQQSGIHPSQSNSNTAAADHDKRIKSHVSELQSHPLTPLLDESFNHLQLSAMDPSPDLGDPSCNSAHSSEKGKRNSDHHRSMLVDPPPPPSGFIEQNDHQPALIFSSPPGHHRRRRASSFDFPEIRTNFPVPEEEVDLVEQIYGRDSKSPQSSEDGSDEFKYPYQSSGSSHIPPGWRNKALDEEAWKRAESIRKGAKQLHRSQSGLDHIDIPSDSRSPTRSMSSPGPTSAFTNSHLSPPGLKPTARPTITLDEYAERMKMAAIMLAQLSASQQPSQSLTMTSSSAAGMVVGGAIGLGAGFVGVTVGAGLGAVVSRRLVGNGQTIITSPIGRKDYNNHQNSTTAQNVNGQGSSGLSAKLDISSAVKNTKTGGIKNYDEITSPRIGAGSVPKQKLLTPQQSQAIKDKIMAEMMLLEEERMKRMRLDQLGYQRNKLRPSSSSEEGSKTTQQVEEEENLADEEVVMKAVNEDDPSGKMLSESWEKKRNRIRLSSPYGHLSNWNLFSVIVKTGTDLRQEQIIIQLIHEFGRIWNEESINVWVKYYGILVTGESTGLMETIVDAVSIHSLKKSAYSKLSSIKQKNSSKQISSNQPNAGSTSGGLPNYSLFDHYVDTYGPPKGKKFKIAQENFMRSLVSYSIITYILQIKDRHNGNILIDKDGHIIHIDFGFVLNNSPGSIAFEMSPFKLNQDYLQVLNPPDSFISIVDGKRHIFNDSQNHNQNQGHMPFLDNHHIGSSENNPLNLFNNFVDLFKLSFKKIRKHAERIITIVELMQVESKLPCFGGGKNNIGEQVIKNLRDRFQLNLNSEEKLDEFIDKLILSSINSVFTRLYDSFQYFSQGVL